MKTGRNELSNYCCLSFYVTIHAFHSLRNCTYKYLYDCALHANVYHTCGHSSCKNMVLYIKLKFPSPKFLFLDIFCTTLVIDQGPVYQERKIAPA